MSARPTATQDEMNELCDIYLKLIQILQEANQTLTRYMGGLSSRLAICESELPTWKHERDHYKKVVENMTQDMAVMREHYEAKIKDLNSEIAQLQVIFSSFFSLFLFFIGLNRDFASSNSLIQI